MAPRRIYGPVEPRWMTAKRIANEKVWQYKRVSDRDYHNAVYKHWHRMDPKKLTKEGKLKRESMLAQIRAHDMAGTTYMGSLTRRSKAKPEPRTGPWRWGIRRTQYYNENHNRWKLPADYTVTQERTRKLKWLYRKYGPIPWGSRYGNKHVPRIRKF
jgi:hypothetical protein